MSNVISIRNPYAVASQPASDRTGNASVNSSPLHFHAYERPLFYEGKEGTRYGSTGHKALVRMHEDKPVCLNVVKDSYKVVQNADLFQAIESGLRSALGPTADRADIIDKLAYGGRTCYRQYVFRGIEVDSPERDKIIFRVIIQNGFGGSAIKLHAGAIDMFCTNGMILGDFTSEYAKHTSGVKINRFKETVEMAADVFWKNKGTWRMLRDTVIKADKVEEWLKEQFSERLGLKLFHAYLIEQRVRGGNNMWALYSTLTRYASHATGDFTLRETKNDHAAASMLKREQDVHKIWQSESFRELAA